MNSNIAGLLPVIALIIVSAVKSGLLSVQGVLKCQDYLRKEEK